MNDCVGADAFICAKNQTDFQFRGLVRGGFFCMDVSKRP